MAGALASSRTLRLTSTESVFAGKAISVSSATVPSEWFSTTRTLVNGTSADTPPVGNTGVNDTPRA